MAEVDGGLFRRRGSVLGLWRRVGDELHFRLPELRAALENVRGVLVQTAVGVLHVPEPPLDVEAARFRVLLHGFLLGVRDSVHWASERRMLPRVARCERLTSCSDDAGSVQVNRAALRSDVVHHFEML